MADKSKVLYDKLAAENYRLPDYDTFSKVLQDKGKREEFYNRLRRTHSLPDFETFDYHIGSRPMTFGENVKHVVGKATAFADSVVDPEKIEKRDLGKDVHAFGKGVREIRETIVNIPRIAGEGYAGGVAASELNKADPNAEVIARNMKAAQPTGQTATERRAAAGSEGIIPAGFKENPVSWLIETAAKSVSATLPEILDKAPAHVLAGMGTGAAVGSAAGGVGAVPGAVAGAGMAVPTLMYNSSAVQRQAEYVFGALKDRGVDVANQQAVEQALSDKKLMAELKAKAAPGAVTQGFFDAISVLGAGKIAAPVAKKLGGGVVGKVAGEAGEYVAQAATGMAGEAGAQVAEKGKVTDVQAVMAEGLAEAPAQAVATRAGKFVAKKAYNSVVYSTPRIAERFKQSNPQFTNTVANMAEEFEQRTGEKLRIISAVRTTEEQKAIYNSGVRPAAKPGSSRHEKGLAIDVDSKQAVVLDKLGILSKYGLENLSRIGDTNHIQLSGKAPVEQQALDMLPDDVRQQFEADQVALAPEQAPVEPTAIETMQTDFVEPAKNVAEKIAAGETLTVADRQIYDNNPQAVEAELKILAEQPAQQVAEPAAPVGDATAYHGTRIDFEDFDFGKIGTQTPHLKNTSRRGVFFSSSKDEAEFYTEEYDNDFNKRLGASPRVIEKSIDRSTLYQVNAGDSDPTQYLDSKFDDIVGQAEENGDAGVLVRSTGDYPDAYFVFDEKAFAEGKPVPSEVLADYPDLQPEQKLGKPGTATTEELSSASWKEASLGMRMYEGESLSQPVKERLGQTGALYYQQVSHIKTKEAATTYAKGKDVMVLADIVQDRRADIDPEVRVALGKEVLHQLDAQGWTLRAQGNTAEAEAIEQRAGDLAASLSRTATQLGRAIEYMKEFDPTDPDKMIGGIVRITDDAKAPVEKPIEDIVDGLNKENENVVDDVVRDPKVRAKVIKAKSKKLRDQSLWDAYVESISESMDVVEAAKASAKEKGALQMFAADVRKTFLSKIKKPEVAGKPRRSAIYVVRDQIANSKEVYAAWATARERILQESPNAEQLAGLIPEQLDAPFSVADIRKVFREMGAFDVKKIARTWGEDRVALTDAIVEALMQDQQIAPTEYAQIEKALRATIDGIVGTEKAKMAATQERLAANHKARSEARQKAKAAGKPINPDQKAVAAILTKLTKEVTPSAPATPMQEFTRRLISSLTEKVTMPGQKGKKVTDYLGLIKEAIENQDRYRDVWEQAREAAMEKYPHISGQLAELFDDLEAIYPNSAISGALTDAITEAQINLTGLVRQHYTVVDRTGRSLGKKIADKLQVSEAEAESIAAAVEEVFRERVVARKKAMLAALMKERTQVKAVVKGQTDKIIELSNIGALSSDDVFALVAKKLGLPNATPKDFATLRRLANEVQEQAKDRGDFDYSIDYWRKRKELEDFYLGLAPSHNLKIITGVVGRGNLVASIKSTITNVVGNTALFSTEAVSRRIVDRTWSRANTKFGGEYKKYVQQVFRETGYDPTRMMTLADSQKRLGEEVVHTQGPGGVRKAGRFVEDMIFKKLLGDSDVRFSAIHFTDAVDLLATKMATKIVGEADVQAKALELFKDAIRIEPTTEEGKAIRERAVMDALRGTLTDTNIAAKATLGLRQLLNNTTGDVRAGDLLIPFAKTPATVKWRMLEAMGVTIPYDFYRMKKAVDTGSSLEIRDAAKSLVVASLGVSAGLIFANILGPDDYVDEYNLVEDSDRSLLKSLGGAYAAFRFGKTYISADYFGPLAGPMSAWMQVKKFGSDASTKVRFGQYVAQAWKLAAGIPGMDVVAGVTTGIPKFMRALKTAEGTDRYIADATQGVVDFFVVRTIPALVGDIAKAFDSVERTTERGTAAGVAQSVAQSIPGLRGMTPAKIDLFSEPMEAQPWYGSLLFGARLKVGRSGGAFDELQRLQSVGELPTLTDIRYTSSRAKRLETQIGKDSYEQALARYGELFKLNADGMLSSNNYWNLEDEQKRDQWSKIKKAALDRTLTEFGYRKND